MAFVEKVEAKTETVVKVIEPEHYEVTLSKEEAELIMSVVGRIYTPNVDHIVNVASLYNAFRDTGLKNKWDKGATSITLNYDEVGW